MILFCFPHVRPDVQHQPPRLPYHENTPYSKLKKTAMYLKDDNFLLACHLIKNLGDVSRTAEEYGSPLHRVQQLKSKIFYEHRHFFWDKAPSKPEYALAAGMERMRLETQLVVHLDLLKEVRVRGMWHTIWLDESLHLIDEISRLNSQTTHALFHCVLIDIEPLEHFIASLPDSSVRPDVQPNVQPQSPGLPYHGGKPPLVENQDMMHSNRDKARAIRNLIVNLGDVQKTADELQIPERTLRRWKSTILREGRLIYWDEDLPPFQVYQRYERIRVSMLIETERLLTRMSEVNPMDAAEIATSVTRLTDRLAKIETIMERLGQYVIKIDTGVLENLIVTLEERERQQIHDQKEQEQPENDVSEQGEIDGLRQRHHHKKRRNRPPSRKKIANSGR